MSRDDWRAHARCDGADPEVFNPLGPRGGLNLPAAVHAARAWCGPCPVRDACRDEAEQLGAEAILQGGVWWPARTSRRSPLDLLGLLDDTTGRVAA